MADSEHAEIGNTSNTLDLYSDESGNITRDDNDGSLFITPSNVRDIDDSEEEDDFFLSELLVDTNMVASSPIIAAGNKSTGDSAVTADDLGSDTAKPTVSSDPFEDSELNDSILLRCSEQVEKNHFDMSFSDSEEEGDIPSLLTRVRKNIGFCGIDTKPPPCPPKKGTKVKSSKIISVAGPSRMVEGEDDKEKSEKNEKSRFHRASENEIESLQLDAKAARTHQQTKWGIKILKEWLRDTGRPEDIEGLEVEEIGQLLRVFYVEVRQKDGTEYSRSSLICIRSAIHRHLTGPPYNRKINIMSDGSCTASNAIIAGKIRNKKKRGEDTTQRHPPIKKEDIKKMYSSGVLSKDNPEALRFKTFFEVSLHFGRRGREGLRELNKRDIIFKEDESGIEYATLRFNPYEKNNSGENHHVQEHIQKMYGTGGADCPVASLKFYLAKLHPECEALFQKCKGPEYVKSMIWYCDKPLGVNPIGNLMATISDRAALSIRYTNHCIRATTVTSLRDAGVAPSDIVAVTGHRSLASIDSYSTCNDAARKDMSHKLSSIVGIKVKETEGEGSGIGARPKVMKTPESVKKIGFAVNSTPVMMVEPTPRSVKPIPRCSPRLQAMREANRNKEVSSAKKLVYDNEGTDGTVDIDLSDSKHSGKHVIIIKGGNVNIHYH